MTVAEKKKTITENVLMICKHKEQLDKYKNTLIKSTFIGSELKKTLKIWDEYLKETGKEIVDSEVYNWGLMAHKFKGIDSFAGIFFDNIKIATEGDLPQDQVENFGKRMAHEVAAAKTKELMDKFYVGDLDDLSEQLKRVADELNAVLKRNKEVLPFRLTNQILLDLMNHKDGLQWPLPELARAMRPLLKGDFGILSGNPDGGKTSLLAFLCVAFAKQLPVGKKVLWLNNESTEDRILIRCIQSALNMTNKELKMMAESDIDIMSEFDKEFNEPNKIEVFSVHGLSANDLQDIIEKYDPGFVVFDMLDNISWEGGHANGGTRTDQMLESLYQWARTMSTIYCPMIAASQQSVEAKTMRWPLPTMLKDSKVGKQGACEFQIMVGEDLNHPDIRYISTPKNKLENEIRDIHAEIFFDRSRCRYISQQEVEQEVCDFYQPDNDNDWGNGNEWN